MKTLWHCVVCCCAIWTFLCRGDGSLASSPAEESDDFLRSIMSRLRDERMSNDGPGLHKGPVYRGHSAHKIRSKSSGHSRSKSGKKDVDGFGDGKRDVKNPFGFVQPDLNNGQPGWGQLFNDQHQQNQLGLPSNTVPYNVNGQSNVAFAQQPSPFQFSNVHDAFSAFNGAGTPAVVAPSSPPLNLDQTQQTLDLLQQQNNYQLPLQDPNQNNGILPLTPGIYPIGNQFFGQPNDPAAIGQNYYLLNGVQNNGLIDENHLIDSAVGTVPDAPIFGGAEVFIKKFPIEPLFAAMAGFVGIAVVFMGAVLFLPKVLDHKPEPNKLNVIKNLPELTSLTKIAVKAVEGHDCTERIACEVGRAMRGLHFEDKPIKMLEVILPPNLAQQLVIIRKAISDKRNCRLIQCKGHNNEQISKLRNAPLDKQEMKVAEQIIINSSANSKNNNNAASKKSNIYKEENITPAEPRIIIVTPKNTEPSTTSKPPKIAENKPISKKEKDQQGTTMGKYPNGGTIVDQNDLEKLLLELWLHRLKNSQVSTTSTTKAPPKKRNAPSTTTKKPNKNSTN